MTALLVALTFAGLVALDYFVIRRRRVQNEAEIPDEHPLAGLQSLTEAIRRLPSGVFLQPPFTWSRIREDGNLLVGIHPLLLGLVGAPHRIELLDPGERVEKGEPLARIARDGRHLTVVSPFSGRIAAANHHRRGETEWRRLEAKDGSWIYRIEPDGVSEDVAGWMIGDRAVEWTRERYRSVREFLMRDFSVLELGVALADGGEVPVGILAALDETAWLHFEDTFLKP